MGTPFFTIVTITFQNLAGLRATIESLNPQSYRDFEHIVIDGGSTDGTAEWLAANFEGTWVSEPDDGRYQAMNKGARMASGEYLWFMHASDLFGDATVLSRVASAILCWPEGAPEWLYGLARLVGPNKRLEGILGYIPFRLFDLAILQRVLPHQASAINRDLFWRLGGFDETEPVAADQLMFLRAAQYAPPLVLADFLCDFDSTGYSAGRATWVLYREAALHLKKLDAPITRWRALDAILLLTFAVFRHIARAMRRELGL